MPPGRLPEELLRRADLWTGDRQAAVVASSTGFAALDQRLPGGGWPHGALVELIGDGLIRPELALALPTLVRLTREGRQAALVGPPHLPYAPALHRAGVDLRQLWVLTTDKDSDTVWAMEQLLRTPSCGFVLGWPRRLDERNQRRLQLAAEHSGAIALAARPPRSAGDPSVAAVRLRVTARPDGGIDVTVVKARGGRTSAPFLLEAAR